MSTAATATTAAAPPAIAGTWALDHVHSSASFAVRHMVVATFRGRFEQLDATLRDGRLEGAVETGSIQVKDENLAAHLRAPDFFDTARHPQIRFASTSLERDGEQLVLRGELTIKGITQPVEARGTIAGPHRDIAGDEKLGISLHTVVDRTQYGLSWNAPLPKGGVALADDVALTVELELVRAEA